MDKPAIGTVLLVTDHAESYVVLQEIRLEKCDPPKDTQITKGRSGTVEIGIVRDECAVPVPYSPGRYPAMWSAVTEVLTPGE
jgi:hypothetical protein